MQEVVGRDLAISAKTDTDSRYLRAHLLGCPIRVASAEPAFAQETGAYFWMVVHNLEAALLLTGQEATVSHWRPTTPPMPLGS